MSVDSILQPFQHFGVNLGLARIQKLLSNLGNPQQQVPIVHVAGTNGKGSVCAYLSAVLTEAGYRVGRYISPHLVDWTERICINQQQISLADFEQYLLKAIAGIQPEDESPTQFEIITAAAWLYFAEKQVDIAVIEVGLGGRLDATNVCEKPLVTIITSISREHWQVLGPTLADIAGEKAGILKAQRPAVVGQLPPEAKAVVEKRLQELGCPVVWPQPALDLGGGWVEYLGTSESTTASLQYPLPLLGKVQLMNSAIAVAALQLLQQQGWKISETVLQQGMAKTQWPARLQWITWKHHKLLIDGAHNPAAALALRQYIDSLNCELKIEDNLRFKVKMEAVSKQPVNLNINWVMGMLSTKDHADIFQALLKKGDRLYLVPVPDHSSASTEALATLAQKICPDLSHCQTYPDVLTALDATVTDNHLTVLCGSLYLIGHFFQQPWQP